MAHATGVSITACLTASKNNEYKYTTELIEFPGWKAVDGYEKENPSYNYLQNIKKNSIIPYIKMKATVTMNDLKSQYKKEDTWKRATFMVKKLSVPTLSYYPMSYLKCRQNENLVMKKIN